MKKAETAATVDTYIGLYIIVIHIEVRQNKYNTKKYSTKPPLQMRGVPSRDTAKNTTDVPL